MHKLQEFHNELIRTSYSTNPTSYPYIMHLYWQEIQVGIFASKAHRIKNRMQKRQIAFLSRLPIGTSSDCNSGRRPNFPEKTLAWRRWRGNISNKRRISNKSRFQNGIFKVCLKCFPINKSSFRIISIFSWTIMTLLSLFFIDETTVFRKS